MRLFTLLLFCAALTTSLAEPEPKKYKVQQKKNKPSNTTLTDDEKKFIREVEAKFSIKPDVKEDNKDDKKDKEVTTKADTKLPFPAVIAIEIVNDTDTKTKGKRTIDANLGYGYKTNNGYSYSYFGNPGQDKGKFMIYPYSQKDIPAGHGSGESSVTHVEIQPSKAFELVSVKDENEGYEYPKPSNGLDTKYDSGLVSPSSYLQSHGGYQTGIPSTLYTTYNGHEFSGLSGQFPTVMPNYFVDPSQLLQNPEYQNVGFTNEHLRLHGSHATDQRVVPVLVLRIPSSSLKNPTAELFANLPSNYPLSSYLNTVDLQGLVNQYFKKLGYSFAPPVTAHHNSAGAPTAGGISDYRKQHYAAPYVQPSYTQSDHSGVQYSAVQPVMAKYPSVYPQRFNLPHGHSLYQQPMHQQKYEYQYQHVPQTAVAPQTYYTQSQYQQQTHGVVASAPETNSYDTSTEVVYYTSPQVSTHDSGAYEYRTAQGQHLDEASKAAAYEYLKQANVEAGSPAYESVATSEGLQGYQNQHENSENEALAYHHQSKQAEQSYPEQSHGYEGRAQSQANLSGTQNYHYQQQSSEDTDGNNLVLSENYPSKDHTLATVFPVNYKSSVQNTGAVQTVSYVTPMPYSSKFQLPYKVMVPQTFLVNPSTERVSYVNSHSVSAYPQAGHQDYNNPEAEYTVGPHYVPPISKQKPPSYPRNYHSHPKRMAKPDRTTTSQSRKHNEKKEHTKSA